MKPKIYRRQLHIMLTPLQDRELLRMSKENKRSIADIVRNGIELMLHDQRLVWQVKDDNKRQK